VEVGAARAIWTCPSAVAPARMSRAPTPAPVREPASSLVAQCTQATLGRPARLATETVIFAPLASRCRSVTARSSKGDGWYRDDPNHGPTFRDTLIPATRPAPGGRGKLGAITSAERPGGSPAVLR